MSLYDPVQKRGQAALHNAQIRHGQNRDILSLKVGLREFSGLFLNKRNPHLTEDRTHLSPAVFSGTVCIPDQDRSGILRRDGPLEVAVFENRHIAALDSVKDTSAHRENNSKHQCIYYKNFQQPYKARFSFSFHSEPVLNHSLSLSTVPREPCAEAFILDRNTCVPSQALQNAIWSLAAGDR